MDTTGTLDEALQRLHDYGPERDGWLSNHGPMAVEALVRNGHATTVHRWLDYYRDKLEDLPRATDPITADGWQDALGDPAGPATGRRTSFARPPTGRGARCWWSGGHACFRASPPVPPTR